MDENEFFDYPCSNSIASSLGDMWLNYSYTAFHGSIDQYAAYVCRFSDYWAKRDICASIEGYSALILGAFGLVGSFITVLTMWQRRFRNQSDFSLFRAVGYLEIVQMTFIMTITALAYFHCEISHTCAFLWAHVATTVNNICADGVDIIVFFLSLERTIACLLPHIFKRIHKKEFVYLVVAISLTLPAFFAVCQAFEIRIVYSSDDSRYIDVPSDFSQTDFYSAIVQINSIRLYISVVLITGATISSVIGFKMVSARQNRLLNRDNSSRYNFSLKSQQSKEVDDNAGEQQNLVHGKISETTLSLSSSTSQTNSPSSGKKRQMDLCCLQLCLAAPVVVNLLLYTTGLSTNYSFITGRAAFDQNLSYKEAIREIEKAESFLVLRTSTNVSNVLAHALHFYLYLLFSANLRKGVLEMFTGGTKI